MRKSVTSRDIATIIGQLQEYERYFLTYESLAKYLNNAGLPQMSMRLADILVDIRNATQTYRQLHQMRENSERCGSVCPSCLRSDDGSTHYGEHICPNCGTTWI